MRQRQPRKTDADHLAFVRSLPCCVCGNDIETEAAHVRFADPRVAKRQTGKGEKPSDEWSVPLCGQCHRRQHTGDERLFWAGARIDPIFVALALSRVSGDTEAGEQIAQNARDRDALARQSYIDYCNDGNKP